MFQRSKKVKNLQYSLIDLQVFESFHCFLGIYFAVAAAFGPAVGYVVGGFTLKVYTNFGTR